MAKSAKRWKAFLNNHREAIAAMDFFTVPSLTLGALYCFFVIAHRLHVATGRRQMDRLAHFSISTPNLMT